MAIRLIALDFDGIIPTEESPLYLFDKLGKRAQSDLLAAEFYSGLANAKNPKDADSIPGIVWKKSFELYKEFPTRKMKRIMQGLGVVKGAKVLFNYCISNHIKIAIISATIRPILVWNLSAHGLYPDWLFCSESTIREGRFDRLLSVMSPIEKRARLERLLLAQKIENSECLVVGDSLSELHMFKLVGKTNSVAFNYRQDLEKYCDHLLFKQNDASRNLEKIIGLIQSKK